MTDDATVDNDISGRVAEIDNRRAEGLSVSAACRAAGISTSTYYRRKRAERAPAAELASAAEAESVGAVALVSQQVAPGWPFADATPRAPLFWDQAFADEMTDSFVRRAFGAVDGKARPVRPAFLAPARDGWLNRFVRQSRKIWRRLAAGPAGLVVPPLAAIALIALLVFAAGWMVSLAANPAAWLSHPTATEVASATDTSGP